MTTRGATMTAVGAFLLFAVIGCSRSTDQPLLPEITSETEEGFHDLVFAIREHKALTEGGQVLHAAGVHQGQVVGFELYLGPTWERISVGDVLPIETYRGVVMYRSLGQESDRLVQTMNALYRTRLGVSKMSAEATFTGITLGGDPRRLSEGVVKIKLFFEPGPEDLYAELFTNIDFGSKKIYVTEKDEEYRLPIIKALGGDTNG